MSKKNYFPPVIKAVTVNLALATVFFGLLYHVYHRQWMLTAAISVGTTCYHFAIRLIVGLLVPQGRLDHRSKWFRPRSWEDPFYKILKVKSWKTCLPTYDPSGFSLKENTLSCIIRNTCGAEVVHEVIMVCSFVPLLFTFLFGAFPVFLITSILAALFDSLFVIIQRYNRPRLVRILEKQEAKRS